ncbi:MAG: hypothetical protein RL757_3110 [Bacteroidota bacterium]|jgi:hypothetical protein
MKFQKITTPPVSALVLMLFCLSFTFLGESCRVKSGCPTKDYHAKVNRNGELSSKHGKTNLFPKSMRKKMKSK